MSSLPQQARSVSEILTASFELYKESFTKLIGYSVIIAVCQTFLYIHALNASSDKISQIQTPATITTPQIDPSSMSVEEITAAQKQNQDIKAAQSAQKQALDEAVNEVNSDLKGVQIAFGLLALVLNSAMIYRIDNVINKRDDDYVGSMLSAVKKLHLLFIASILYIIAITIGSFLLVIPGLILIVSLLFFGFLILLEDQGIFESLMSSHRLVWGNWWRTNLVFFIPAFALTVVLGIVFAFMFSNSIATDATATDNLQNIMEMMPTVFVGFGILNAFISPYFVVLAYLQYLDLKLRSN